MRDDDRFHSRRRDAHPLYDGSQIWMPRDDQLRVPSRRTQRRRRKSPFRSLAAGEDELAVAHRHAMQLGRIVQKLNSRHSILRLSANSLMTAAK